MFRLSICALVLPAFLHLASCSSNSGTSMGDVGDLLEVRHDLPGDLSEADAAADILDVVVFDPLLYCPASGSISTATVIPRPQAVYQWGTLETDCLSCAEPTVLSGATFSAVGVPEGDEPELQQLLHGLSRVDSGAALEVLVHGADQFQAVHDACRLPALNGNQGAYYIWSQEAQGAVQVHIFAPDPLGSFYALKTLGQMVTHDQKAVYLATMFDQPVGKLRGVLEGFYGKPWSQDDRLAMMRELANLKFNQFIYSPKGDGMINLGWPTPYSASDLKYIKTLIAEANRQHIEVCWQLHFMWPVIFSSDKDIENITEKLGLVVDRGATCLLLGFDDLEKVLVPEDAKVYDSYSQAQGEWLVRVGEALRERYPEIRLVLTPHEYYSNHPEFATDLAAIAKGLPDYWDIGWTGTEIVSRQVTKGDAEGFSAAIGRLPILGDNYPVNDMQVLFNGEWYVHLGPLEGRATELPSMLPGVVFNASADTFGALPALASVADYVWNPKGYDPERALKNGAYLYGGPDGGSAALELMASNCRSPDITDSVAPALEKLIDELWEAWDSADEQAYLMPKGTLAQELAKFRDLPDAVTQAPHFHPGLLANIQPHIDRMGDYGRVGLMALSALQSKREGKTIVSSITDEITALIEASRQELAPMPTGQIMPAFLERALEELL